MSQPHDRLEALVVGAGPAGATAALTLARAGRRVAIVERETLPRYKTCGGGVVRRVTDLLPAGVTLATERAFHAVDMNLLDAGLAFTVRRETPLVEMAMRAELDRSLVDAAVSAGATLRAPCEVEGLEHGADEVLVATTSGPVRAAFVVAADGALGPVARWAGCTEPPYSIPALEAEARVPAHVLERFSHARFDFGGIEAGYGWVFPKREHLSVGVLTMRRGRARLPDRLDDYLRRIGLTEIDALERHGHVIPVRPRPGGPARGRVLLVGDAAGLADPLTGEGISYAVGSGQLAAEAVIEAVPDPTAVRAAYRAGLRPMLGDLRVARLLAHVLYRRPATIRSLLRRHGAALCEAMTDVIVGTRSYRSLAYDPRNWLRLVLGSGRAAS